MPPVMAENPGMGNQSGIAIKLHPMTPQPTSPPTSPRDAEEVVLLLRFVHERDIRCPRCDYNLRNLTQPVCPECRDELHLSVGLRRPQLAWLIAALAPGIFSGIAAFFMGAMLIVINLSPTGRADWRMYVLDAFGWLSAIVCVALFFRRYKFLKQASQVQMTITGGIWFVHVAFFMVMWAFMR